MNKVFVVMMVKDEIDIIGYNIEYLQTQDIDHFYIADNLSTDGTKELLKEHSKKYDNITLIDDNEFGYYQSDKMNLWCNTCFKMGANIIIPIDADEIWYSIDETKTLGNVLKESEHDIFVANAIDYIPTNNDPIDDNPIVSMCYRKKNSNSFSSVAFRKYPGFFLEMGNHNVVNHPGSRIENLIGIRHYQYRSFSQFEKKVKNGKRVYECTSIPDYIGSHWRNLGNMTEDQMRGWWAEYINQDVEYDPFQALNYLV
jgi:hypothetical protein